MNQSGPELGQDPPQFLVAGIGASAGGIDALKDFFAAVPRDSGIAYAVILHLSPDHDSQLAAILQTIAAIPVTKVEERTRVEPDHIYVIPPNAHLKLVDGHIEPSPNLTMEERRAPVDIFFRSLAESHHGRGVAVILSGTGANGSMGLKRVKEKGGVVFVQNPREAQFSDMPRAAIATDLVDAILPAGAIPARVMEYAGQKRAVQLPAGKDEQPEESQAALREIFTALRTRTGHDFSGYKRATLLRRIGRRINVHGLSGLPAYASFMAETPDEATALLKDLLISVTNFFRDKNAFNALEDDILPRIFAHKKAGSAVRIWCAGCATGEEAYSLAMLCAERTSGVIDALKIQIFASDIDEDAIAHARDGLYTLNDAADVSPERLRRFFTKEGDAYRIRREIRETVLFASHNVLKDPPFSHLDLATCRNMLIYLSGAAQERVMETMHFALNPGGYMFLGSSETADKTGNLFATHSHEHHIYQSRAVSARPMPVPTGASTFRHGHRAPEAALVESEPLTHARASFSDLHQQMLEVYAPPSLIVNAEYDILHLSERAGRYLQIGGGELSQNLLKIIRPELRLEVRTALYQAVQRGTAVAAKNLKVRVDEHTETLTIHVRPVLRPGDAALGFILVVFETVGDENVAEGTGPEVTLDDTVALHLDDELIRMKAQLRMAVEQHELQAEELKASNEELQAMNEELRSAAEELETSKEELQSVNEELSTVNQELKVKVEELSMTGSNLQNLVNSTAIATVFLDRSLRVALFTPPACDIFNLIPADYGRPLSDITNKLDYDALQTDAEAVLDKLATIEREIATTDRAYYLMRVSPYRTEEDRISGVVITFLDITARREAEAVIAANMQATTLLRELGARLTTEVDAQKLYSEILSAAITLSHADAGTVQILDEGAQELVMLASQGFDHSMTEHFHRIDARADTAYAIAMRKNERTLVRHDVPESQDRSGDLRRHVHAGYLSGQSTPLVTRSGRSIGMLSTHWCEHHQPTAHELRFLDLLARQAADLIERLQFEAALRESEQRFRAFVTASSDVVYNMSADWTEMHSLVGRDFIANTDRPNSSWFETYIHPDDHSPVQEAIREAIRGKRMFELEHRVLRVDGTPGWTFSRAIPLLDDAGQVKSWFGTARDVTERKEAEDALRQIDTRLQAIIGNLPGGAVFIVDKDYRYIFAEGEALRATGFSSEDFVGKTVREAIPEMAGKHEKLYSRSLAGEAFTEEHNEGDRAFVTRGVPLRDAAGNVYAVLAVSYDITDRYKAEEALRASEQRLQLSILGANLFTWEVNVQTGETSYSANFNEVLGFEIAQISNQNFIHIHPNDAEAVTAAVGLAMRGEEPLDVEHRIIRPVIGDLIWVRAQGQLIRDGSGTPSRFIGITQNITRQKEAEAALRKSEERTRTITDAVPQLIWTNEAAGEAVYFNRRWYEYSGLSFEQSSGPGWQAIVHPDDAPASNARWQQALSTGAIFDTEYRLRGADGKYRWFIGRNVPLKDASGRATGWFGTATDIQDLKVAEDAVRASETRFRAIVNQSTAGIVEFDLEGNHSLVNQKYCDLLGYTEAEILRLNNRDVVHPDDLPRCLELFEKVVATGEAFINEKRMLRKDGRPVWVTDTVSPISGADGCIQRVTAIVFDVSERKAVEEALQESRQRLRVTMESATDYAIITTDAKGSIEAWSKGAEKIFGWSESEVKGQSTDLIFTPEDRAGGIPQAEMQKAREAGRAEDERWHMRRDGSRFFLSGVMTPIYDGKLSGYVRVARDLTEKRAGDEALRDSEKRQRIVLEAADLGTWDWDVTEDRAVWNNKHYTLFGLVPDGEPRSSADFECVVHVDDRQQVRDALMASVNTPDKIYQAEFRIVRADNGQVRWMVGYGKAMARYENGRATRMTGVMYDITQRRETEQRKDEFLGVASHELKTPLTAIKAYAEILEDMIGDSDAGATGVVRKLDDGIDRLDRLIRDLLDATRINEGRLELKMELLDLAALCRDTAEEMQRAAGTHRVEVEAGDALPFIRADRERVRQVLTNILSNAIKYSPAADRVVVGITAKKNAVQVSVEDFGVGISDAAAGRVFDRFFREPDPSVSTFPGLGLGLYIAREIVQLHGGQSTVRSEKGRGSTFCFILPVGA